MYDVRTVRVIAIITWFPVVMRVRLMIIIIHSLYRNKHSL